jgi:hypothetical protein
MPWICLVLSRLSFYILPPPIRFGLHLSHELSFWVFDYSFLSITLKYRLFYSEILVFVPIDSFVPIELIAVKC